MTTILDEIVHTRRARLAEEMSRWPLARLCDRLQPSDRDFAGALRAIRPAFILECKKASPSRGLIRSEYDLADIATTYGRYASAISVLTEPDYFQGGLEHLAAVRRHVDQPLLCKDFIVDPWQVYAARHFGADAILLILAIVDDHQWRELSQLATSLGMATLTEVANRDEQRRAVQLGASIVGINNRNLRDMTIDPGTTRDLAVGLPADTIVISESGYHTNAQVRGMSDVADGFLVGSSLMSRPDLTVAVKRLIFGDHKICGLTRAADAGLADRCGAVYGGAIFARTSPRLVSVDQVNRQFGETGLRRVGVFQDQPLEFVQSAIAGAGLHVVQLHGREATGYVSQLRQLIPDSVEIWKAMSLDGLPGSQHDMVMAGAARILVDQQTGGRFGGTGLTVDWSRLPDHDRQRLMLAGGLGPDNVQQALQLNCAGLDFNSALEIAPGNKSAELIRELFDLIRKY